MGFYTWPFFAVGKKISWLPNPGALGTGNHSKASIQGTNVLLLKMGKENSYPPWNQQFAPENEGPLKKEIPIGNHHF